LPVRGCLPLVLGFVLGVALMLVFWPKVPDATRVPSRNDVHVTISDKYLSRVITKRLHDAGLTTVSHLVVASSPSRLLVVNADISIAGISVPIALSAQPYVSKGQVQVRLLSTSVGGIPLPTQIIAPVSGSIQSSLHNLLGKTAVVKAVRVRPAGVEIFADERL
jgi:uncharacterized protein YpmS